MVAPTAQASPTPFYMWTGSIASEVCVMPTVLEPEKEAKPQLVPPTPVPPELFAAEIAMEERSFNFLPILLAVALVGIIAGGIYYFVKSSQEVVSVSTATQIINNVLGGPATTKFSTGTVEPNNGPKEPQYQLLSKGGVVVTKPKGATSLVVAITDTGETLLSRIDGVKKVKRFDGGTNYTVPLAERKLVAIDKITLLKAHMARVDYTWKWAPNRLGQEYDASGSLIQSFSTWDRTTLINSYGADFYSAEPTKASIIVAEGDDGVWKKYTEQ